MAEVRFYTSPMREWLLPLGPWLIVVAVCVYIISRLVHTIRRTVEIRRRYQDLPCLPRHPIWGNIINCGEKLSSGTRHPDYGFERIWEELGRPPCFLMDLAPIEDHVFLILAEPRAAEALVNPSAQYKYSAPKSDTFAALNRLVGAESLSSQENEDWRTLRKRFNPGFQPKYLNSLAPSVVAQTKVFVRRLEEAAADGRVFALGDYAKDLTTDIITQLTIERDLKAQSTPEGRDEKGLFGILRASRRLSELTPKIGTGLKLLHRLNLVRPIKAVFYEYVLDHGLSTIVRAQQSAISLRKADSTKSIAQLAMAGLAPSSALIRNTVHQVKTFLFAGQDTTATLIQWLCWELARHPGVLSQLRAEHDAAFGPGPGSAEEVLGGRTEEAERILGVCLPYTTAVIKETLRLHPPGATVRQLPAGSSGAEIDVDGSGRPVACDGLRVYVNQWLIHRNPGVWGPDAHDFRPARWLDAAYVAGLPAGAWRPFERGPRACIGQDLALLEAKVVLAMVSRRFRFHKVGLTGRDGEDEIWEAWATTKVPADRMMVRVYHEQFPPRFNETDSIR